MSRRGVIYYNTGTSCAVRLLVSLHSLRNHYNGPVTILSEGAESDALCNRIGGALGAEVKRWDCGVEPGKNRAYLAKTRYHAGTPYDTTVALDSDTLVVGGIGELFDHAENAFFCVAQLAAWQTGGRIIGGRLRQWSAHLPELVEPALDFGPAINCGVVAFRKNASIFGEWSRLAVPGRELFIPDEVCCQLILPRHPHRILDGRWNRSCKHDDPDAPDTRIIHFHGRKHCRPGLPYHANKWVAAFDEVMRGNIANVREWSPAGDRMLARHLKARGAKPVYETDLWCRRGHFNHDQADKYAEICEREKPANVLEIGFCTGRSTACVLHHTTESLRRMISIDINLDYKAPHGRKMAAMFKRKFPKWSIIENASREVLNPNFFQQEFPEGIDLATIDGDHTYEGCTFDLESVAPFMKESGVIVVDDYRSGRPNGTLIKSVTRSVDDFLAKHSGFFSGEYWQNKGKGFCIISRQKAEI